MKLSEEEKDLIKRAKLNEEEKRAKLNEVPSSGVIANLKTLSNNLTIGGIALVLISAYWWYSFYGAITKAMNAKLADAFSCLYSSSGVCALASSAAQAVGKTPYEPIVLWIGVIAALAGGAMGTITSPEGNAGKSKVSAHFLWSVAVLFLTAVYMLYFS